VFIIAATVTVLQLADRRGQTAWLPGDTMYTMTLFIFFLNYPL